MKLSRQYFSRIKSVIKRRRRLMLIIYLCLAGITICLAGMTIVVLNINNEYYNLSKPNTDEILHEKSNGYIEVDSPSESYSLLDQRDTTVAPTTQRESVESINSLAFWVLSIIVVTIVLVSFLVLRKLSTVKRLNSAPGTRLLLLADFFYSKKTVEEVFKPIVADWRTEYFEALKEDRKLKAYWISVRYIHSFLVAMGLSRFFSLIRSFTSAIK